MENNKPPDEVAQAVVKGFGLESLYAGNHFSPDRTLLTIDSIWIVELPLYFGVDIYMAGVNQTKWTPEDEGARASNFYRGLLLVAPFSRFDFYGADPYRLIDLEWPDEMAKSLQSLNMLPYYASISQLDGTSDDYRVHTYWSGGGEGHASYRRVTSKRPEIKGFLNTILHTIKSMAAVYNDDEINQLIKRGRNRFG
jgi:hypothetical protein